VGLQEVLGPEDTQPRGQRTGTQAEEPLPVNTVKCRPGVMV
jgi:hypothetical protein